MNDAFRFLLPLFINRFWLFSVYHMLFWCTWCSSFYTSGIIYQRHHFFLHYCTLTLCYCLNLSFFTPIFSSPFSSNPHCCFHFHDTIVLGYTYIYTNCTRRDSNHGPSCNFSKKIHSLKRSSICCRIHFTLLSSFPIFSSQKHINAIRCLALLTFPNCP